MLTWDLSWVTTPCPGCQSTQGLYDIILMFSTSRRSRTKPSLATVTRRGENPRFKDPKDRSIIHQSGQSERIWVAKELEKVKLFHIHHVDPFFMVHSFQREYAILGNNNHSHQIQPKIGSRFLWMTWSHPSFFREFLADLILLGTPRVESGGMPMVTQR